MKAVVQRVAQAEVRVEQRCVGAVRQGLLALIGVGPLDGETQIAAMLGKILKLRIFPAPDGRMSLSLADIQGGLLLVPNFTLMADVGRGARPSFTPAAPPEHASVCYTRMLELAREQHADVASGIFGADMQVSLINDGPVTVMLEV